jgi:hypothetical protein
MENIFWLDILKADMTKISNAEAIKYWRSVADNHIPYFDYRLEHVKQVERDAMTLHNIIGGDKEIILASVWIHDRFKFEPGNHCEKGSEWAVENLEKIKFPREKINDVSYCVKVHSGWQINDIQTTEAKILWDADKLAHFGPIEFFNKIIRLTSKEVYQDYMGIGESNGIISIESYISALSRSKGSSELATQLDEWFYFQETKDIAAQRINAVTIFVEALENHFNG